jgi:hypothetical protein
MNDHGNQCETVSGPDDAWIAYRYVAGECDEAEAIAFELRLAEDQSARDALSEAVRLVEAVCATAPSTVSIATQVQSPQVHRSSRARDFASLAAAAMVTVASGLGLWWSMSADHHKRPTAPIAEVPGDRQLIVLYHTAGRIAPDDEADPSPALSDEESVDLELSENAGSDWEIPDWMLAGLDESADENAPADGDEMETF